jgi:hypothetical protein
MMDMTTATTEAAKNHHMWGFSVEFWNSVIVWTIAIAAVAGAISVAPGFVAGIVGYRLSDVTQKATEAQVAEANARAEAAKLQSAEANARAAEAKLALEKYKAPRSIDATALANIRDALQKYAGQEYQITTFWDLKEPLAFSEQLHQTLQQAGWKFIPHGAGGSFLLGGISGVQVWVHPNAASNVSEAADALITVLSQLDFAPVRKQQDASAAGDNIIRLNVGTKY